MPSFRYDWVVRRSNGMHQGMTTFFTWSLGMDINQCSVHRDQTDQKRYREEAAPKRWDVQQNVGNNSSEENVWNENKKSMTLFYTQESISLRDI